MRFFISVILAVFAVGIIQAQPTVNGQFVVVSNTGGQYSVRIQIDASAAAGLGSATFQFEFNTASVSYPSPPVQGTDYAYQNFSGGSYVSTVTRPLANRISVNIAYNGVEGAGTTVPTSFVDVVTINFTTLQPNGSSNLHWVLQEVFADDNLTQWTNGTFPDFNTSPLPITLSSFAAVVLPDAEGVKLDWATMSETDNYGFEVQKSQTAQAGFASIPNSLVPGHGTTIQPHSYSYVDSSVGQGKWYYRLRQIDLDGTITYSEAVEASIVTSVTPNPLPRQLALDQNYPNPFNPTTVIKFSLPKETRITLDVFNVIGQHVVTLFDGVKPAGFYDVTFRSDGLASGIYFYRLTTNEKSFVKKMMLVK